MKTTTATKQNYRRKIINKQCIVISVYTSVLGYHPHLHLSACIVVSTCIFHVLQIVNYFCSYKTRCYFLSPLADSEDAFDDKLRIKTIWEQEEENELNQLRKLEVRHGFDEMVEMTREGKLWKYPIDNEQGKEQP